MTLLVTTAVATPPKGFTRTDLVRVTISGPISASATDQVRDADPVPGQRAGLHLQQLQRLGEMTLKGRSPSPPTTSRS